MVKRSSIRFCELPFLPGKCGTVFRRENNDYFKHWIGPFSNILGHLFAHFPLDPLSFSLHGLQQCGPHCLKEGYSRPESKGLVLGRDTDTGVIRQLDSIGMYCMSVYPRNGLKVDNFNRKICIFQIWAYVLCHVLPIKMALMALEGPNLHFGSWVSRDSRGPSACPQWKSLNSKKLWNSLLPRGPIVSVGPVGSRNLPFASFCPKTCGQILLSPCPKLLKICSLIF